MFSNSHLAAEPFFLDARSTSPMPGSGAATGGDGSQAWVTAPLPWQPPFQTRVSRLSDALVLHTEEAPEACGV